MQLKLKHIFITKDIATTFVKQSAFENVENTRIAANYRDQAYLRCGASSLFFLNTHLNKLCRLRLDGVANIGCIIMADGCLVAGARI
jgi:hypothetical protein